MAKIVLISSLALLLAAGAVYRYGRTGYETAEYRVLVDDSPFQLRQYSELQLVTTPMERWDAEQDGSFMRLFRYISGDNDSGRKISMTTPVFMSRESEAGRMSFVVPREVAARGAPAALNPDIKVETMASGRFAAIRFSGRRTPKALSAAMRRLEGWIEEKGWQKRGSPLVAGYDPPFIPPPLRRNEVLYRIEDGQAAR
jgi:hypothetical protein